MGRWFFSLLALVGAQRDGSLARRAAFVGWMSAPVYLLFALWTLGGCLLAQRESTLDGNILAGAALYGFAMSGAWIAIALYGTRLDAQQRPDDACEAYTQCVLWCYASTTALTCYLVGTLNIIAGLAMMGAPLIGMMLFPVRQVLGVFAVGTVAILAAGVASALGLIPYAPILGPSLVIDTRPGLYYAMSGTLGAGLYVTYEVVIMTALVSAWHYREAGVRALSITDMLTGVANRRHILDELERLLAIHARRGETVAVIMVDIDHFKQINDRYGHIAGDRALAAAAGALRHCLRGSDQVGRYGGEEFLVLLPAASPEDAREVAERCRTAISQTVIQVGDTHFTLTASLGVASRNALDVRDADHLIHVADEAMYLAKQNGRDRVITA